MGAEPEPVPVGAVTRPHQHTTALKPDAAALAAPRLNARSCDAFRNPNRSETGSGDPVGSNQNCPTTQWFGAASDGSEDQRHAAGNL